jgi:hypothetical protein
VELSSGSDLSYGFINRNGKMVIPADKNMKSSFSDGLASVRVWGSDRKATYGYMDTAGKMVIPARYKKTGRFSEGLAFVWDGKKLAIINKTGAIVATLPYKVGDYDTMPVFSSGFAAPPIGWRPKGSDQWGFINKQGKLVFTNLGIWSVRTDFSEGVAWVYFSESKEGACIDTNGKILFKVANFYDAKEFCCGAAPVEIRGQRGVAYYDRAGHVIWK